MSNPSGMTQHEVAKVMGISQARVLQLEQSAMRKLRKSKDARELLQHVRFIPEQRVEAK